MRSLWFYNAIMVKGKQVLPLEVSRYHVEEKLQEKILVFYLWLSNEYTYSLKRNSILYKHKDMLVI